MRKKRTLTQQNRDRIGQAIKGRPRIDLLGISRPQDVSDKISVSNTGKKLTKEQTRKLSLSHIGNRHSVETRKKQSEAHRGSKSSLWRGGITPLNKLIRKSVEYRLWREAVFERDDFTCRFCGIHGGDLEADHIKQFAYFPELRFELSNGRTLCKVCHRKTPTYGTSKICSL